MINIKKVFEKTYYLMSAQVWAVMMIVSYLMLMYYKIYNADSVINLLTYLLLIIVSVVGLLYFVFHAKELMRK